MVEGKFPYRFVVLGIGLFCGTVIVFGVGIKQLIAYGKKKKEALLFKVAVKKDELFQATLQKRLDMTTKYLKSEKYNIPIFPSKEEIQEGESYQTCFDLNPNCRRPNWMGISEYLSLCSISEILSCRQLIAEYFLTSFQESLFNVAGLPFPLSWFLPSSLVQGEIPLHPQQIIQSSVVITPSILTTFMDIQNFKDRNILQQEIDNDIKEDSPRRARFPSRCYLSKVYEYYPAPDDETSDLKPVNENLFPGLMLGLAPHNRPVFQGQHAVRNLVFSEICSRLSNNFALQAGIPGSEDGDSIFTVVMPDNTEITRIDDLVEYLINHGCKCTCNIRVTTAVLNFTTCIKKSVFFDDPPIDDEPDKEYFDVPFGVFTRTGVYSEKYETEAVLPLLHGGLNIVCSGELDGFGDISFQEQFYLGFDSPARWHCRNGGYDGVSWNPGKIIDEWIEKEDVIRCVRLTAWFGSVLNALALNDNLSSFGYGLLGVCSDSVAPIQHVLRGNTSLYPLFAVGKYKVKLCRDIMRLVQGGNEKLNDLDLQDLKDLQVATMHVPSDNYLEPSRYEDTLNRINISIPWDEGEEPFASLVVARKIVESELEIINNNNK